VLAELVCNLKITRGICMKTRKEWLENIDTLMKSYCDGCFVFDHYKKEKSRRYAHNFCIHQCTVGEQIKNIGDRLSNKEQV
jgi:hypothetical protein